jgi:hypothetical protein
MMVTSPLRPRVRSAGVRLLTRAAEQTDRSRANGRQGGPTSGAHHEELR